MKDLLEFIQANPILSVIMWFLAMLGVGEIAQGLGQIGSRCACRRQCSEKPFDEP